MHNHHQETPLVLFVDDEQSILNAVKRLFYDEDISVITEKKPERAAEILNEKSVAVLVSDLRMPHMDGNALFDAAARISPRTVRIAFSGYADKKTILESLNKGHIWHFIEKPWNDHSFVFTIKKAIERYTITAERDHYYAALLKLNNTLEQSITEKTAELSINNKLLLTILRGNDIDAIMEISREYFSDIFGLEHFLLYIGHEDRYWNSRADHVPGWAKILTQETLSSMTACESNEGFGYPLIQNGECIGIFLGRRKSGLSAEKLWQQSETFLNIILIALEHSLVLEHTPRLIAQLDEILTASVF